VDVLYEINRHRCPSSILWNCVFHSDIPVPFPHVHSFSPSHPSPHTCCRASMTTLQRCSWLSSQFPPSAPSSAPTAANAFNHFLSLREVSGGHALIHLLLHAFRSSLVSRFTLMWLRGGEGWKGAHLLSIITCCKSFSTSSSTHLITFTLSSLCRISTQPPLSSAAARK
jgi:hypothetical protein